MQDFADLRPVRSGATTVDVVAFGESSVDVVGSLGPREARSTKHSLRALEVRVGGQMATAAVGVARLGFRSAYVGVLGSDLLAGQVRQALEAERVAVHAIVRQAVPSRSAIVLVGEEGDREILEFRHPRLALRSDEIPVETLTSGRLLLVDATDAPASVAAMRACRARAIPTVVDVDRVSPATEALLLEADVIIAPEPFVREWSGDSDVEMGLQGMARRFRQAGLVVATLGPAGSLAVAGDRSVVTPGFRVPVVDTTGAGDAFRAGFAASWLTGASLEDILAAANATAALNCRMVGAQSGLPTWAEVMALCNGRPA